jgi:hypothetical protein
MSILAYFTVLVITYKMTKNRELSRIICDWKSSLASSGNSVVEHSSTNPEIAGSNPVAIRDDKKKFRENHIHRNFKKIRNKYKQWTLYYKILYSRNLRIFIIGWSVCPWKTFPAQSNVCR